MTRRDVVGTFLALLTICTVSWVIGTYPWLAWVVLAGALVYVLIGSFVVLVLQGRTSRSREVSLPRTPARSTGSLPRSGGPGRASSGLGGSTRARDLSGNTRRRPPSRTGMWL